MKIPEGYLPVMPYLVVEDAHKFIEFAKAIFSATLRYEHPRSEGIIMHAELQIQDAVIMFAMLRNNTCRALPVCSCILIMLMKYMKKW